ncbi:MAG: hypothetical protein LBK67_01155 [Coriobacteriales bacterium]|jgi:hypothetical protein|nr:hypothetical protein [Coriobacteriales bacterium]
MAGKIENLRPATHNDQIAGGKARARQRREQKEMKEALRALLDMPMGKGRLHDFHSINEAEGRNITLQEAILLSQALKAANGDTQAATFIRDTSGNKPNDKIEVGAMPAPLIIDDIPLNA